MPYSINETHDPDLQSWVESANDPSTDFPIQNLPLATMIRPVEDSESSGGYTLSAVVAIGDMLVDLNRLSMTELAPEDDEDWDFIAVDQIVAEGKWSGLRTKVQKLLLKDNGALRDHRQRDDIVIPRDDSMLAMPFVDPIGDYTDFYASLNHATNVGSMFRPDNPLLPNYKHIPIGYHGRASSIVPSGTEVMRPVGQQAPSEEGGNPSFGPCKLLDYEMEMGAFIGRANELGEPIDINNAEDHILGLCILNDWSARDLQKWEYVPLGPFLAKNFASTISPYIVTMEALAPFRTPAMERDAGDPQPLPYMDSDANRKSGGFDIKVEVHLASAKMREQGMDPVHLSTGNMKDMYWTFAQMVTHHTVNGCNLNPGDLLGSGTISGTTRDSRGSMLELTWDGDPFASPPVSAPGTQRTPIVLPTGEERRFIADGDEVIMKAYCEREGYRRIGFGECRGIIESARTV